MRYLLMTAAILICGFAHAANDQQIWTFDRLERVGGHSTTIEGAPRVIDSPVGKAIEFDGVDDALFVDAHPLTGAKTFTWEAIFRPDGGQAAQRWFHLQESGSDNRLLFELRVLNGKWYFDSYLHSGENQKALIDQNKVYPVLAWYHVAAVYDGREFRNYVNGVQEGAAVIGFAPPGSGRSSVGVRINRVNYFKGAIHAARFTRRALSPSEFLRLRGSWTPVSFSAGDGATVRGDLYGTGGRGVVLAHGGRFDKASWGEQAHAWSKAGFRVLAADLRFDHAKADVLAAVRYLRRTGAKSVSIVGGSFGGGAAAEAALDAQPGEIDRLVFLGATPDRSLEKLAIPKLFIMARDDADGSGQPRLIRLRQVYDEAAEPKELIVLDGDAHAQYLFATDQRERVMKDIERFLSRP